MVIIWLRSHDMVTIWLRVSGFGYDLVTEIDDLVTIWLRADTSRKKYGYGQLRCKNSSDA